MGGGPPDFPQGSTCLAVLWILLAPSGFRVRGFHPLWPAFPKPFPYPSGHLSQSVTPGCSHPGLGSSHFARRYFGNRVFFLFLWVLRCFSSPGSPHAPMDSVHAGGGLPRRVSPFRHPRINGYLLLPEAFRSLSRLSSALSAKASTLRSSSLDLMAGVASPAMASLVLDVFFLSLAYDVADLSAVISSRLQYAVFKVHWHRKKIRHGEMLAFRHGCILFSVSRACTRPKEPSGS